MCCCVLLICPRPTLFPVDRQTDRTLSPYWSGDAPIKREGAFWRSFVTTKQELHVWQQLEQPGEANPTGKVVSVTQAIGRIVAYYLPPQMSFSDELLMNQAHKIRTSFGEKQQTVVNSSSSSSSTVLPRGCLQANRPASSVLISTGSPFFFLPPELTVV